MLVHRVLGRTAEPRDHPVGGRLPRVALALVRRDVLRPLAWTSAVVRKTPGWPRSWASFSLLQLYSHRDAWANLHLLGQPTRNPSLVRPRLLKPEIHRVDPEYGPTLRLLIWIFSQTAGSTCEF